MIVVDTSAVFAIVAKEGDAESYLEAMASADQVSISAMSLLELKIALARKLGLHVAEQVRENLERARFQIVPLDGVQSEHAFDAWQRFGKGRGRRPAILNFGDCASYALARSLNAPLLFKGDDFAETDIQPALKLP